MRSHPDPWCRLVSPDTEYAIGRLSPMADAPTGHKGAAIVASARWIESASLALLRIPLGVIAHPSAPAFWSSHSCIWLRRSPRPRSGTAILIRNRKLASGSQRSSRSSIAPSSSCCCWVMPPERLHHRLMFRSHVLPRHSRSAVSAMPTRANADSQFPRL